MTELRKFHELSPDDPLIRPAAHAPLTTGAMAKALAASKQALSAMRGQVADLAKIAADLASISDRIAKLEARR